MTEEAKPLYVIDGDDELKHMDWLVSVITGQQYEFMDESRDYVDAAHFSALLDFYWTLENWIQKCLLVDIVQDELIIRGTDPAQDRAIEAVAADILRAPGEEDDWVYFPKVEALQCLTGVNHFNANREEVRAAIERELDARGLTRAG